MLNEEKPGDGVGTKIEPLIFSDDPDLMKDEDGKEQEIREDKGFCLLCAKYYDKDTFIRVRIGPVVIFVCKKCNIVLHNINVILQRARDRMAEKEKEAKATIEEASSKLFVPKGMIVGKKRFGEVN